MKIKRFFAPDMRRAIQLVRAEHGADAVILSSRAVDGGVEIVSAVDYDEDLIAQMIQPGARSRQDALVDANAESAFESNASEAVDANASKSADASANKTVDATARRKADATAGKTVDTLAGTTPDTSAGKTVDATAGKAVDVPAGKTSAATIVKAAFRRARKDARAARGDAGPARSSTTPSAVSTRTDAPSEVSRPASTEVSTHAARAPTHAAPPASAKKAVAATSGRASAKPATRAAVAARAERGAAGRTSPRGEDPSIVALRNELTAMRSMLCRQLAQIRWADRRMLEPERALLASRVARLGLEPDLAETLVAEIDDPGHARAWREVMYGLARRLDVPKEDPLDEGGVFALVGPTGVGKTTTIAKLAARHCMRYGRESLALISTDTYRIGAQRQLDAYGAILGVPVRQASGAAELKRLLGSLSDRRLVLIDTAGLSSRDRRLGEAMASLDADRRVRRLVVLSATMQLGVMEEAVAAFGGDALAGAVLTKLDETDSLGPALSVLIRRKLKAMWLSHGQRVPEDLRLARIIHLIRWALDEPRFAEQDDLHDLAVGGARVAAAEVMHAGL